MYLPFSYRGNFISSVIFSSTFGGFSTYIWRPCLIFIYCWNSSSMMTVRSACPTVMQKNPYLKGDSAGEGCLVGAIVILLFPGIFNSKKLPRLPTHQYSREASKQPIHFLLFIMPDWLLSSWLWLWYYSFLLRRSVKADCFITWKRKQSHT